MGGIGTKEQQQEWNLSKKVRKEIYIQMQNSRKRGVIMFGDVLYKYDGKDKRLVNDHKRTIFADCLYGEGDLV